MDKSFHYMIMVNQSLFQKKVLDALSPYKLTAGQPKVLDYLGKHNGCIQKSIATGCQICLLYTSTIHCINGCTVFYLHS